MTIWFDKSLKFLIKITYITSQKMKFSIKGFFSKCDQIRRWLRIWSHLLKKSLIENFIFCVMNVLVGYEKYIQQWFDYIRKIKLLWLTKLHDFLTVPWCLFLETPIFKVKFVILIKITLKSWESCNCHSNLKNSIFCFI